MIKQILRSPVFTAVLFVAAAALIAFGGIGAARAVPRIVSNDWRGEVELTDIETALVENDIVVEGHDTLLGKSFLEPNKLGDKAENFKYGTTYDEVLSVRNVGTIDQYVRVTVYKFWEDADGAKQSGLNPDYIDLHFVEGDGWTIDKKASTPERTVLYYDKILGCAEGSETGNATDSTPFADKLTINGAVATVTSVKDGEVTYDYDGKTFRIKAVVDAVQTHNGEVAMTGAWGRTV